ncbi:MAG TPA: hypothetical protein VN837_01550 [Chloroflexota bacterium]|nr:hypothetical protein [Chloroflexota bacterium]
MRANESTPQARDQEAQGRPGRPERQFGEYRSQLDGEIEAGYKALAEENHALAEQAIVVDNETWPIR